MTKIYIHILIVLLILGCSQKRDSNQIIAVINDVEIYNTEIDSLIKQEVYQLKIKLLGQLISKKIIVLEAKKQGLELEDFVEKNINDKTGKVTKEEFKTYINEHQIDYVDTNNIYQYLTVVKEKEKFDLYVDSLMNFYDISIRLAPPDTKFINMDNVMSFPLNIKTLKR